MIYENLNLDIIRSSVEELFQDKTIYPEQRRIKLYTGVGGYDLFSEGIEESMGFKRVYIGLKVPRFLRKLGFKILLSPRGRYYKLVKI